MVKEKSTIKRSRRATDTDVAQQGAVLLMVQKRRQADVGGIAWMALGGGDLEGSRESGSPVMMSTLCRC